MHLAQTYAGVRPPRTVGSFHGFGLQGPSDPDVTPRLDPSQAAWVQHLLDVYAQNDFAKGLTGAHLIATFQKRWNANANKLVPVIALRTDGVLDEETLCALIFAATDDRASTPFPDPTGQFCKSPVVHQNMSVAAKVGVGVAVAAAAGGILYAATRTQGKR